MNHFAGAKRTQSDDYLTILNPAFGSQVDGLGQNVDGLSMDYACLIVPIACGIARKFQPRAIDPSQNLLIKRHLARILAGLHGPKLRVDCTMVLSRVQFTG